MAKPDVPCTRCGKLTYRGGKGGISPNGRVCRPCRAIAPAPYVRHGAGLPARLNCRCGWCAVQFMPRSRGDARTVNRYCSRLCFGQAQGDAVRGRNLTYRQCEVCDKEYRYTYSKQRTCGRTCGAVLHVREMPPRLIKVKVLPPPKVCAWCGRPGFTKHSAVCSRAMESRARRSSPVVYGTCVECGILFVRRAGRLGAYCSERCGNRVRHRDDRHRRKTIAKVGDRISLARLGERDGWRCHICKRKVSKQHGNKPNAPSIDHLVPTSLGGQHIWSNVALAHRSCNGKRSNTGHAQLLLIA